MKVLVLIANGSEEIETTTAIDILRRANLAVTVASVAPSPTVTCSRGVVITADTVLTGTDHAQFDAVLLPGGLQGAKTFADGHLNALLVDYERAGKIVAAICAAPMALASAGVFKGRKLTSHPVARPHLNDFIYQEHNVVVDANLITSRCPGTAMEFALTLVERLTDCATRTQLERDLYLQ